MNYVSDAISDWINDNRPKFNGLPITFDLENIEGRDDSIYGNVMGYAYDKILGYEWWGCYAGGDWEFPVYFILYRTIESQEEFEIYVPTEGNVFNKLTNEAYGNDNAQDYLACPEDSLPEYMLEEGYSPSEDDPIVDYIWEDDDLASPSKLRKDIQAFLQRQHDELKSKLLAEAAL